MISILKSEEKNAMRMWFLTICDLKKKTSWMIACVKQKKKSEFIVSLEIFSHAND